MNQLWMPPEAGTLRGKVEPPAIWRDLARPFGRGGRATSIEHPVSNIPTKLTHFPKLLPAFFTFPSFFLLFVTFPYFSLLWPITHLEA
jgi:hypothetical protein